MKRPRAPRRVTGFVLDKNVEQLLEVMAFTFGTTRSELVMRAISSTHESLSDRERARVRAIIEARWPSPPTSSAA